MGSWSRFLVVLGDRRVLRELSFLVVGIVIAYLFLRGTIKDPVPDEAVLLSVLCFVPIVIFVAYLRDRPNSLIQIIEDVAEETEQVFADNVEHGSSKSSAESMLFPELDEADPACSNDRSTATLVTPLPSGTERTDSPQPIS